MARTITSEREQLKAHAIMLRKQGWTEQRIADEIGVHRTTLVHWLRASFDQNATMGKTVNSWHRDHNATHNDLVKHLHFQSFIGNLEDLQTNIRFPLIVADPPWKILAERGELLNLQYFD